MVDMETRPSTFISPTRCTRGSKRRVSRTYRTSTSGLHAMALVCRAFTARSSARVRLSCSLRWIGRMGLAFTTAISSCRSAAKGNTIHAAGRACLAGSPSNNRLRMGRHGRATQRLRTSRTRPRVGVPMDSLWSTDLDRCCLLRARAAYVSYAPETPAPSYLAVHIPAEHRYYGFVEDAPPRALHRLICGKRKSSPGSGLTGEVAVAG